MYRFTSDDVDLDDLRSRLRKMTDAQVLAFGKSARYMCSRALTLACRRGNLLSFSCGRRERNGNGGERLVQSSSHSQADQ